MTGKTPIAAAWADGIITYGCGLGIVAVCFSIVVGWI